MRMMNANNLATALMLVEVNKARDAANYISTLIHNNDACSAETSLSLNQAIKVHWDIITHTEMRHKITNNIQYYNLHAKIQKKNKQ